jgi:hypothetical protein
MFTKFQIKEGHLSCLLHADWDTDTESELHRQGHTGTTLESGLRLKYIGYQAENRNRKTRSVFYLLFVPVCSKMVTNLDI